MGMRRGVGEVPVQSSIAGANKTETRRWERKKKSKGNRREMQGVKNMKGPKERNEKRWVGGGAECVFCRLKVHDSARLIRKSSQETLVCSIPSSPLLSFLQYTLSRSLLALLHSLPLIYDFRCSYLQGVLNEK